MCGIIGVASRRAVTDREWLSAGCAAMAHRGPDDSGSWWSPNGNIGLAQRRLAIIDLSPGGHQPMHDEANRLSIVFNGEIYNYLDLRELLAAKGHKFRTQSDTEVVLAAYHEWGTDCLAHLNGMFAIALYDGNRNLLFLARDRAGEKPLFYSATDGGLRFSSELKGLLADSTFNRSINPAALDCYLMMGYVPGDACILQSARKLPPAHALTFDLANEAIKIWRYWRLPEAPAGGESDDEALVDELEALLADSVRRQLVASDVPVGVLLSGGVDSSLVTAMAARASSHVKTFTVGFDGYGNYDETGFARLIANHFGTDHVELQAGSTSPDILDLLARQYDEPLERLVDDSDFPCQPARAAALHSSARRRRRRRDVRRLRAVPAPALDEVAVRTSAVGVTQGRGQKLATWCCRRAFGDATGYRRSELISTHDCPALPPTSAHPSAAR